MEKSEFYTLSGYRLKNHVTLTESMEDYLEMMIRLYTDHITISITQMSQALNVKPSSVTKMCHRLREDEWIYFEPYGTITLSDKGKEMGFYLLKRHQVLEQLLHRINQRDFNLEQVEKLEHFIDEKTVHNIERFLNQSNF